MELAVDDAAGSGSPVVCLPMLGATRGATAVAFGPAFRGAGALREVYLDLARHAASVDAGLAGPLRHLTATSTYVANEDVRHPSSVTF